MNPNTRRLLIAVAPLAAIGLIVHLWQWPRDMMNQPGSKPQEGVMTPFPAHSVPVGGYPTPVLGRLEAHRLANPAAATTESIARGRTFYAVFCVPCHGAGGLGDGPVASKLPVPPMNLTNDFIQKEAFENWIFAMISFGGRFMPAYANDLSVAERWDVVNYVRNGLAHPATPATAAAGGPARQPDAGPR
jgi:mono/diheme cytochrome c family protein